MRIVKNMSMVRSKKTQMSTRGDHIVTMAYSTNWRRSIHRCPSGMSWSSFVVDRGIIVLTSIIGHRSFFHTSPRSSCKIIRLWNAMIIQMVKKVRGTMASKKRANVMWPYGLSSTTFIPKACYNSMINKCAGCYGSSPTATNVAGKKIMVM